MKKMFLVPLAFAAVVAAGYVSYGAYSPQSEEDALLLENVEALTKGDVTGNTHPKSMESHFKCGVPMGGGSSCTTEVISCPGGGTGCTPRKCPIHGC